MNGRRGFNECEAGLHTAALYFKGGVARAKGRGYAKWAGPTSNIPPPSPPFPAVPAEPEPPQRPPPGSAPPRIPMGGRSGGARGAPRAAPPFGLGFARPRAAPEPPLTTGVT